MKKNKQVAVFELPNELTMIGTFKLKDKEGHSAVKLNLKEAIKAVVIQKVAGENNKFVIAVEKGEISQIKLIGR